MDVGFSGIHLCTRCCGDARRRDVIDEKTIFFIYCWRENEGVLYAGNDFYYKKVKKSLVPFLFFPYFCGINIEKCL